MAASSDVVALRQNDSVLHDTYETWTEVYVVVSGAGTVYVSGDGDKMKIPNQQVVAGIPFTQANTNPAYRLTWIGRLYIFTSDPAMVIIITNPKKVEAA